MIMVRMMRTIAVMMAVMMMLVMRTAKIMKDVRWHQATLRCGDGGDGGDGGDSSGDSGGVVISGFIDHPAIKHGIGHFSFVMYIAVSKQTHSHPISQ